MVVYGPKHIKKLAKEYITINRLGTSTMLLNYPPKI